MATSLIGGAGNDKLTATAAGSAYSISGLAGNDTLTGGASNDTIYGGTGNDVIIGGAGNDRIWGEDGLDQIQGGAGNDTINAGAGNDAIYGGKGNDSLTGGAGTDNFLFRRVDGGFDYVHGTGEVDLINDFEGAGDGWGNDFIQFYGFTDAHLTRVDSVKSPNLTYYQIYEGSDPHNVIMVIGFTNMGAGKPGLVAGDYVFY